MIFAIFSYFYFPQKGRARGEEGAGMVILLGLYPSHKISLEMNVLCRTH